MHLSIDDVKKIIKINKPKLSIITHFGMTIIRNQPWEIAKDLSNETNTKVIAASDGLSIKISDFL